MMLNKRMVGGLVLSAAVAAGTMVPAFAYDKSKPVDFTKAPGAAIQADLTDIPLGENGTASYTVTAKGDSTDALNFTLGELMTDEDGNQYYLAENGTKIYISQKEDGLAEDGATQYNVTTAGQMDPGTKLDLGELMTDEDGNQYYQLEDGTKIYVSTSKGVSVTDNGTAKFTPAE